MEDDLIFKNGRQPQYYENLIFLKMEDDLNFLKMKVDLIFMNVNLLHSTAHTTNQPDQHNKLE